MRTIFSLILGLFTLCLSNLAFGGVDPIVVRLKGNQINQGVVSVKDRYFSNYGQPNLPFAVPSALCRIKFRYDDASRAHHTSSWEEKIIIKMKVWTLNPENGALEESNFENVEMKIDFSADGVYSDIDIIHLNWAVRIDLQVLALHRNGVNDTAPFPDLYLEIEQQTQRNWVENIAIAPVLTAQLPENNQILVAWDYVLGADSYDLEWLFIDYPQTDLLPGDAEQLHFDFDQATRINTSDQHYYIPLHYPEGYLLFRVRARKAIQTAVPGPWSLVPNRGDFGSQSDAEINFSMQIESDYLLVHGGSEPSFNWQYTVSFAEDGKRSESIQYYDGSLRARQSVAYANSNRHRLVAENAYDYYGRQVVQFLPTPVLGEGLSFQYNPQDPTKSFNGNFGPSQFDVDVDNTSVEVEGIVQTWDNPEPATGTGADGYYGNGNSETSGYGLNDYIPSAEEYPYSFVKLKNDGTGRPVSSGSVGNTLRAGAGHEVRYYYSTPTQEELDRLFGSEAGIASHFTKVITVDQNGQGSAQILDQFGRVVATSLVGPIPNNLLGLDLHPEPEQINANLLGNNVIYGLEKTSETNVSNISGAIETRSFYYELGEKCLEDCCYDPTNDINGTVLAVDQDICLDCVYDVEIRITDTYGVPVDPSNVELTLNGVATVWSNPLIMLGVKQGVYQFDLTIEPDMGYRIQKKLKVRSTYYENEILPHLNAYLDYNLTLLDNPLTCEDELCFSNPVIQVEDECLTCEEIYIAQYAVVMEGDVLLHYLDAEGNVLSIEDAEANAILACTGQDNLDPCTIKRMGMLNDLSPGGQYFDNLPNRYEPSADGSLVLGGELNPSYNQNGWLTADMRNAINTFAGQSFADWQEVRDNWSDEWSEVLFPFHPEFYAWKFFCDGGCENKTGINPIVYSESELKSYFTNMWKYSTFDAATANNPEECNYFSPFDCTEFGGFWSEVPNLPSEDNSKYLPIRYKEYDNNLPSSVYDGFMQCFSTFGFSWEGNNYYGSAEEYNQEHLIQNLKQFIEISPGEYHSIWYFLDFPASQEERDLFLVEHPNLAAFYNRFHAPENGLFEVDDENFKFIFFRSIYSFLREFAIYKAYNNLAIDNNAVPELQETAENTGMNAQGFNLYFPKNPMYDAWDESQHNWANFMDVFLEYMMPNQNCSHYQTACDLCSEDADQWINQVVTRHNGVVSEADLMNIRDLLIKVCACGKTSNGMNNIGVEGLSDWIQIPLANLYFSDCPECSSGDGVYDVTHNLYHRSFAEVLAAFGITENEAIPCFPDNKSSVQCGWNNFVEALAPLSLSSPFTPAVVTENLSTIVNYLNDDYGYIDLEGDEQGFISITFTASNISDWVDSYETAMGNGCGDVIVSPTTWPNFIFACPETPSEVESVDLLSACNDAIATLNAYNDAALLEQRKEDFIANHRAAYFSRCMQSEEVFTMQYELNEYYYTLYYYDQAGHLTKTVPPSGVVPLSSQVGPGAMDDLYDVSDLRESGEEDAETGNFIWPAHRMVTNYKYNSHGQIIESTTPDGGTSRFWYDRLDRLVLSQDARQSDLSQYSYVLYDDLSRPYESGVIAGGELAMTWGISRDRNEAGSGLPSFANWLASALSSRREVVTTHYDDVMSSSIATALGAGTPNYLRNRVASITYAVEVIGNTGNYDYATHYKYDIHGNAVTVLQDNQALAWAGNQFKRMDYTFDLLSGATHQVNYQGGSDNTADRRDRFSHHYQYDADNRLTAVYSDFSMHQRLGHADDYFVPLPGNWENDAQYQYYNHGPLGRVELGDKQVQGLDYLYNIQGWLQGVNSSTADRNRDAGRDGSTIANPGLNAGHSINANFGQDAFGFALHYHTNDMVTVGDAVSDVFSTPAGYLDDATNHRDLYNGNISAMTSAIYTDRDGTPGLDANASIWGRNYRYDQLNRIKAAQSYFGGYDNETTTASTQEYSEAFAFDFNGNITQLKRNGSSAGGVAMDDLRYYYLRSGGGVYDPTTGTPTDGLNQLAFVHDMVVPTAYTSDMESQSQGNYVYDAIGNLIHDEAEQIDIVWNQSGKIVEIRPFDTGANVKPALEFVYDAGGQRVAKIVKPRNSNGSIKSQLHWKETHYVYDAGGQVMAVYDRSHTQEGQEYKEIITLSEQHLYGSARLGMRQTSTVVSKRSFSASIDPLTGRFINRQVWANQSANTLPPLTTELSSVENNCIVEQTKRVLGQRLYELSNHLGNVLTVISDRKLSVDIYSYLSQNNGNYTLSTATTHTYLSTPGAGNFTQVTGTDGRVDVYTAEIISSREYSAYGAELPGYSYSVGEYRYGFQNQEIDEELWDGAVSYKYRIEDPRLGRFFSVDPLAPKYPHNSPYAFSENRVVDGVELEGLEYVNVNSVVNNNGQTFLEVFGNDLDPSRLAERNGQTYYHVNFDLYRTPEGNLSFVDAPNNVALTEWFFDEIAPVVEEKNWVSYEAAGRNCFVAASMTCFKEDAPVGYFDKSLQMFDDGKYNITTEESKADGLYAIHRSLERYGRPIMVGINYKEGSENDKTDDTTDHFIVIVGRGEDKNGRYFTYFENASSVLKNATNILINRVYLNDNGELETIEETDCDERSLATGAKVTQVRPGKKNS